MQAKLLTLCMALCAVCLSATSQNVPDYVPTDGLVGWWPLNGDVLDIGPTGMNGVNYGAQCDENRNQSPCEAMSFTAGDYLSIAADSSFTSQEGTMTGWVKLNSYASQSGASGYNHFCNRWAVSSHEFVFAANIDGLYMYVENELFQSDTLPTLNEWHHLAFSYSSINGMAKIYIDGQNVAEFEGVDTLTPTNHPLHIGGNPLVPAYNSVDGSMDDVGFWERTLELSEITAIYNAQLPVLGCTDSIACNFNEEANNEDDSCVYPLFGEDCETGAAACGEGTEWDVTVQACVVPEFCQEDLDGDGVIGVNDLMQLLSVFGTDCPIWMCGDPVNYDGYNYATVQIGEQCWFAENLRTAHYTTGDALAQFVPDSIWIESIEPTVSYFNESIADCDGLLLENNECSIAVIEDCGLLYNGFALSSPLALCPSGWHVAEKPEFDLVLTFLLEHGWDGAIGQGLFSQEVGFNAQKGGYRLHNGDFLHKDEYAYLWTNSVGPGGRWLIKFNETTEEMLWLDYSLPRHGLSVRCIKDTEE